MTEAEEQTMNIKCECGGELRTVTLDSFDFTPLAGLPVTLKSVPGMRCAGCKKATLDGEVINFVTHALASAIARQPERLSSDRARYLRKYLRLTQQALAARLGVVRETVADWERGENAISPQHDLMLRAVVVAEMMHVAKTAPKRQEVVEAISGVRVSEPSTGELVGPVVIGSVLKKLRDGTARHRAAAVHPTRSRAAKPEIKPSKAVARRASGA